MSDIEAIIYLYKLPILAGICAAIALSLFGCLLATKERAIQTLVLSQSATFGALLGMAIVSTYFAGKSGTTFLPLLIAALTASIAYFQSEKLIASHYASKSTFFIFLYLSFIALSYMISSILPSLESHMSRFIFGDLATITNMESYLMIFVSIGVTCFLLMKNQTLYKITFLEMALHTAPSQRDDIRINNLFKVIFLLFVCFSTQTLGLLFTLSLLFLPTILALLCQRHNMNRHQLVAVLIGTIGTILGISISLTVTHLPTVPTVILMIIVTGVFASWI